jgi:hypothetical protein
MKDAQRQTETRTGQINLRATPTDVEKFDAVASELALNRPSALRYLVRKKMRALAAAPGARLPVWAPTKDGQTKTEQIVLFYKLPELEELDALASKIALNRSDTLRYLVDEETRALAASGARPVATTKRGARA